MAVMGRVLVVEDDEGFQRLITLALTAEGYEVILAGDGATGLSKAEAFQPDLILLDIQMPVMDGETLLQRYQQITPAGSRAPIIALTASGNLTTVIDMGVDDFVTKPFAIDKLLSYVRRYMHNAASGRPSKNAGL